MKLPSLTLASMLLWLGASAAGASSIGIYFAPDGSDCDANVAPNESVTLYIVANLSDNPAALGILGAEFRVRNWPSGWASTIAPNPASNLVLGNPLAEGAAIAFANCQQPANGLLLLFTIDAVATSAVTNLVLTIDRNPASNPNLLCPVAAGCGFDPDFPFCVSGGQAFINGAPCNVAVARSTWTQVKSLYRD